MNAAKPPDQPMAANRSKKNMRPNMMPTSLVTYMPAGCENLEF